VLTFQSLDQALKHIHTSPLMEQIDEIWVIGGASVYKEMGFQREIRIPLG